MNLQELFKSVGKQIFVKYYYYFKDSQNYTVADVAKIISEDYTEKSKRSRTGHARMIFNNGWNIEALKIILSSNVPLPVINECKKILEAELNLKQPNKLLDKSFIQEIESIEDKETEKQSLIKIRIGHSKLKEIVLRNKTKCDICGLSHPKLLIASHIKPWSQSSDKEKLDYHNILLLCPMHDALFDKGLISFNDNGRILISNELNNQNRILANIDDSSCINVTSEKQKEYLQWHRENIFIK